MQTQTNNRDTGRTQSFTYDALNRISTAQSAATSGADCWGQSIPTDSTGYDRYGNLKTINSTKCSTQALSINVDSTTNRITSSGFIYDAAGEATLEIPGNYQWDAEGRQTNGRGTTYVYDGDGKRVKKGTTTLFWYGLGSTPLAETDSSGNTTNEYIFFGARIARRDSAGNVYYYFADQIGSSRTITNSTGTICYDADFYPFGGERTPYVNTCSQNYKFAGMERDSETGNDHTMFRYYPQNVAHWMSPDPMGGDITNPQSLNRYAYVMNNPSTLADPLGLFCVVGEPCPGEPYSPPPDPCPGASWGDPYPGNLACNPPAPPPQTGPNPGQGPGAGGSAANSMTNSSSEVPDCQVVLKCVFSLYGVTGVSFTPTQSDFNGDPAVNGSFTGFGPDIHDNSGFNYDEITVTNNVNRYGLLQMPRDSSGRYVLGFTPDNNPYENFTANHGDQRATIETQLIELGNSLSIITGTLTIPQAHARDDKKNPPGKDLLDCVNAGGPK